MLTKLLRAARGVREVGPVDAVRWALVRAEAAGWNRFFGDETDETSTLQAAHAESVAYEPLPWQLIRRGLDGLALTPRDVFLDYGAGKGRALLMAARRGPRRVVGVELLEPLAAAAERNARTAARWLRCPVEVHVADATTWAVPDDVTVVYLFNPFFGSVMAGSQARLRESLGRRRRGLRVLYARVKSQPDLFAPCAWLTRTATLDAGVFRDLSLEVYSTKGAARA